MSEPPSTPEMLGRVQHSGREAGVSALVWQSTVSCVPSSHLHSGAFSNLNLESRVRRSGVSRRQRGRPAAVPAGQQPGTREPLPLHCGPCCSQGLRAWAGLTGANWLLTSDRQMDSTKQLQNMKSGKSPESLFGNSKFFKTLKAGSIFCNSFGVKRHLKWHLCEHFTKFKYSIKILGWSYNLPN